MTIPRKVSEGDVCPFCEKPDWKCLRDNCTGEDEGEDEGEEDFEEERYLDNPWG